MQVSLATFYPVLVLSGTYICNIHIADVISHRMFRNSPKYLAKEVRLTDLLLTFGVAYINLFGLSVHGLLLCVLGVQVCCGHWKGCQQC